MMVEADYLTQKWSSHDERSTRRRLLENAGAWQVPGHVQSQNHGTVAGFVSENNLHAANETLARLECLWGGHQSFSAFFESSERR